MTNPTSPLLAGWLAGPVVLQLLAELEAIEPADPRALLRRYLAHLQAHRRRHWLEEWATDLPPEAGQERP